MDSVIVGFSCFCDCLIPCWTLFHPLLGLFIHGIPGNYNCGNYNCMDEKGFGLKQPNGLTIPATPNDEESKINYANHT